MSYFSEHYNMDKEYSSVSDGVIIFLIFEVILIFCSFVVNFVMLFSICYQRRIETKKFTEPQFTNIVIVQNVADLLLMISKLFVYCYLLYLGHYPGTVICVYDGFFTHFPLCLSGICLCIFTYERKCSINNVRPYFSIHKLLVVSSVFAMVYGTLPLVATGVYEPVPAGFTCTAHSADAYGVITEVIIVFIFITLTYFNVSLWTHFRDAILKTSTFGIRRADTSANVDTLTDNFSNEQRITFSIAAAVFSFFAAYLPYTVIFMIYQSLGKVPSTALSCISNIFVTFVHCINPFIYGLSIPLIRKRIYKTFGGVFFEDSSEPEVFSNATSPVNYRPASRTHNSSNSNVKIPSRTSSSLNDIAEIDEIGDVGYSVNENAGVGYSVDSLESEISSYVTEFSIISNQVNELSDISLQSSLPGFHQTNSPTKAT